jgi:hypothetical protein
MEEALVAYLLSQTSITDLVSSRIHWVQAPQGETKPYITMQVISTGITRAHLGADALSRKRIQVDCYAMTYLSSKAIERAVIALLNNNRIVQGSIRFEAFLDNSRDLTENEAALTPIIYRQSIDLMVTYSTI